MIFNNNINIIIFNNNIIIIIATYISQFTKILSLTALCSIITIFIQPAYIYNNDEGDEVDDDMVEFNSCDVDRGVVQNDTDEDGDDTGDESDRNDDDDGDDEVDDSQL